jgi:hypothetical protein
VKNVSDKLADCQHDTEIKFTFLKLRDFNIICAKVDEFGTLWNRLALKKIALRTLQESINKKRKPKNLARFFF